MRPEFCISPMPDGDCWRACIASIVEVHAASVPNFMHEGAKDRDEGVRRTRAWLAGRGYSLFQTYCSAKWEPQRLLDVFSADNPDTPIIICGTCRDGKTSHAVVALNGAIVHDPSGAGIIAPSLCSCGDPGCGMDWYWLYVISLPSSRGIGKEATDD